MKTPFVFLNLKHKRSCYILNNYLQLITHANGLKAGKDAVVIVPGGIGRVKGPEIRVDGGALLP